MPHKDLKPFKVPRATAARFRQLATRPARIWEKEGERMAVKLANSMIRTVPAYSAFLKKQRFSRMRISNIVDLKNMPVMDKDSYLRKSKFEDLFPGRDLSRMTTFCATSGSTGEPFYFPRGEAQDEQYRYVAELFLKQQFEIDKKRTLGIIGFGLGIWIGGIFTYKNFNRIAADGYPLSLVPTGTSIPFMLDAVRKFGGQFDQIILMGYPPFIKDVLDEGAANGIRWQDHRIRILTAAEGFSEKFRGYISKKARLKNALLDTVNMYGSVELGTMAHETGFSNLIRRIAVARPAVFKALFPGADNEPTLVQYHPYLIHFEEMDGEVLASGYGSGIPLLRYRFHDRGGVIPFDAMVRNLNDCGIDILKEARRAGVDKSLMRLPFVYIYGRGDNVLVLRGANIYAEEVRDALQHRTLSTAVSGRFTMMKKESKNLDKYLEINVELKKSVKPSAALRAKVVGIIVTELRRVNGEYAYLFGLEPSSVLPKVVFWPYQDAIHFGRGGKQKWVKNK